MPKHRDDFMLSQKYHTRIASSSGQLIWLLITVKATNGGKTELLGWVFSVNSRFDGPAVDLDIVLGDGKWMSVCDAEHFSHKIDSGDAFSNWVFDLKGIKICR